MIMSKNTSYTSYTLYFTSFPYGRSKVENGVYHVYGVFYIWK